MTYSTLLTERTGPVLKITTNRPEVLNAQSRILLKELDDAFNAAVDDKDVKVIILAGAGKHFSAGHDLGSPQEMEDQKKTPLEPGFKGEYRRLWERFFENTMRWRDLPKPTIAQVQGYCIMGGMMIASACDIIVASEDAVKRHGLTPRARIMGMATAGVAPRVMGVGPVPATEKLMGAKSLEKAVEVQSDYFKSAYEGFVSQTARLGELYSDLAQEAYKPFEGYVSKASAAK